MKKRGFGMNKEGYSYTIEGTTEFYIYGHISVFNISHGLGKCPSFTKIKKIKGTKNKYYITFDKYNIIITFQNPPTPKNNKITFDWEVVDLLQDMLPNSYAIGVNLALNLKNAKELKNW